jgi:hypothetical protein
LDYQWKEWWYQKEQWITIQLVQHGMSTNCMGTKSFNIINISLKSGFSIQCIYGFTSYLGDYFIWTVQSALFIFFPRSKYTNLEWQLVPWLIFVFQGDLTQIFLIFHPSFLDIPASYCPISSFFLC